jgi:hypothetical protein
VQQHILYTSAKLNGKERILFLVNSKIALVNAGATVGNPASPAPSGVRKSHAWFYHQLNERSLKIK